jgi:CheY-like chemotaxis protein
MSATDAGLARAREVFTEHGRMLRMGVGVAVNGERAGFRVEAMHAGVQRRQPRRSMEVLADRALAVVAQFGNTVDLKSLGRGIERVAVFGSGPEAPRAIEKSLKTESDQAESVLGLVPVGLLPSGFRVEPVDASVPGRQPEFARAVLDDARIIILTTFESDEEVRRAAEAGASGYLLKSLPPNELVETIRQVHAGRKWTPPASRGK